jgi:cysteine-rich repeat protein
VLRRRLIATAVALVAGLGLAADHPVGGKKLLLRDGSGPTARKVKFRAAPDPALDPSLVDPPTTGATLDVFGAGPGDGASGTIVLPPQLWTGIGTPAGSKGWRYLDPLVGTGVKKVVFKAGALVIAGGRAGWPYAVTQPQAAVALRFGSAGEVWCAAFADFAVNQPGKVLGRDAPAPPTCPTTTTTVPPACGDGVATPPEECDDGNLAGGDGCSSSCQLEDASALCAGVPAAAGTALDAVRVASGLFQPTALAAPPLDPRRVFVTEQNGYVRLIRDGTLVATPFLDIHDEVGCCGEQGLLGLAFHPDFETNGRFYVSYTAPPSGTASCADRGAGDNVVVEYHVGPDPEQADESTRVELLRIPQPFSNHNGGNLVFGPDGMLYFGVGDGGGGGDPCETAQSDTDPLGKLYRIDVDAPPASPLDALWAKGVRNPWRFSFDRATGDFYLADVGQNLYEEIDVQPAPVASGLNYGWDDFEARHCFEPPSGCTSPGAIVPVLEYCHFQSDPACDVHPRGCSITGGFVYRGCALPDLRGRYFYSDYCGAWVRSFHGVAGGDAQDVQDHTSDVSPAVGGFTIDQVTSFGEDARGELYVLDQGGEVFKLVPGS